eukprot:TRINITY_DN2885_c0_g1_i3.p1 TRINITY_DN2885_c0_g1~~TRINITY_DN2885_c0_g1_i3.p1  ORF type:complete len:492 (-),score=40.27 TRINITY_DN2885_c0_g1_i3:14-1489(-)
MLRAPHVAWLVLGFAAATTTTTTSTASPLTFTVFTSNQQGADSSATIGVSFKVGGVWTGVQKVVTGLATGVNYSITVNLADHPTELELKMKEPSQNAWGFWKVTLGCWTLVQDPNGRAGSPFPSGSEPPTKWWLNNGDSHAYPSVILSVPLPTAPCGLIQASLSGSPLTFSVFTSDREWAGSTGTAGVSFKVGGVWTGVQQVVTAPQTGMSYSITVNLADYPTELKFEFTDGSEDAWGFWKVTLGCWILLEDPNGRAGSPFPESSEPPTQWWINNGDEQVYSSFVFPVPSLSTSCGYIAPADTSTIVLKQSFWQCGRDDCDVLLVWIVAAAAIVCLTACCLLCFARIQRGRRKQLKDQQTQCESSEFVLNDVHSIGDCRDLKSPGGPFQENSMRRDPLQQAISPAYSLRTPLAISPAQSLRTTKNPFHHFTFEEPHAEEQMVHEAIDIGRDGAWLSAWCQCEPPRQDLATPRGAMRIQPQSPVPYGKAVAS